MKTELTLPTNSTQEDSTNIDLSEFELLLPFTALWGRMIEFKLLLDNIKQINKYIANTAKLFPPKNTKQSSENLVIAQGLIQPDFARIMNFYQNYTWAIQDLNFLLEQEKLFDTQLITEENLLQPLAMFSAALVQTNGLIKQLAPLNDFILFQDSLPAITGLQKLFDSISDNKINIHTLLQKNNTIEKISARKNLKQLTISYNNNISNFFPPYLQSILYLQSAEEKSKKLADLNFSIFYIQNDNFNKISMAKELTTINTSLTSMFELMSVTNQIAELEATIFTKKNTKILCKFFKQIEERRKSNKINHTDSVMEVYLAFKKRFFSLLTLAYSQTNNQTYVLKAIQYHSRQLHIDILQQKSLQTINELFNFNIRWLRMQFDAKINIFSQIVEYQNCKKAIQEKIGSNLLNMTTEQHTVFSRQTANFDLWLAENNASSIIGDINNNSFLINPINSDNVTILKKLASRRQKKLFSVTKLQPQKPLTPDEKKLLIEQAKKIENKPHKKKKISIKTVTPTAPSNSEIPKLSVEEKTKISSPLEEKFSLLNQQYHSYLGQKRIDLLEKHRAEYLKLEKDQDELFIKKLHQQIELIDNKIAELKQAPKKAKKNKKQIPLNTIIQQTKKETTTIQPKVVTQVDKQLTPESLICKMEKSKVEKRTVVVEDKRLLGVIQALQAHLSTDIGVIGSTPFKMLAKNQSVSDYDILIAGDKETFIPALKTLGFKQSIYIEDKILFTRYDKTGATPPVQITLLPTNTRKAYKRIKEYMQNEPDYTVCSFYSVIDTKNATAAIYDFSGEAFRDFDNHQLKMPHKYEALNRIQENPKRLVRAISYLTRFKQLKLDAMLATVFGQIAEQLKEMSEIDRKNLYYKTWECFNALVAKHEKITFFLLLKQFDLLGLYDFTPHSDITFFAAQAFSNHLANLNGKPRIVIDDCSHHNRLFVPSLESSNKKNTGISAEQSCKYKKTSGAENIVKENQFR